MKKRTTLLIEALVLAILAFAGLAHAGDWTCTGSLKDITVDNLRVPQGATCTLLGTYVKGTINVGTNATLLASNVWVIGNVQSENAAQVEVLSGSTVGGNIQIKQGGGAHIASVRIKGDLQFEENRGSLNANNNIIGGNLQAFKNMGGLSITENTIDANLQCKENWPAPTGGDNIVKGNKEDQCAHLNYPSLPVTEGDFADTTWATYSVAKMKISRVGASSDAKTSTVTFNPDYSFSLLETDLTGTYNYTGTWALIKKGKKLSLDLDAVGRTELVRMWTNWLGQVALEEGDTISGIEFALDKLTISQPSIPKGTLTPKRATLGAKGWVSATGNGQPMVKRFSYISKVSYQYKR